MRLDRAGLRAYKEIVSKRMKNVNYREVVSSLYHS